VALAPSKSELQARSKTRKIITLSHELYVSEYNLTRRRDSTFRGP